MGIEIEQLKIADVEITDHKNVNANLCNEIVTLCIYTTRIIGLAHHRHH